MITNDDLALILRLAPKWCLGKVECRHAKGETHLWIHAEPEALVCPLCGTACPIYDHTSERVWRHLDLCDYRSFLHASIPRVMCPTHGVRRIQVSWADPRIALTHAMERRVLDELRATKTTLATARILQLGWDQVHSVMKRGVARGLLRRANQPLHHVAVDEKALAKGQSYVTLIYDIDRSIVLDVVEHRTTESLSLYWQGVPYAIREEIQGIAMDMWQPYITATLQWVPGASWKIVHDRFHVASHMGKAVDDTRIEEHRRLKAEGDYTLTGTKHWWLYGQENLPIRLVDNLARLVATDLQTAQAWTLKENLRHLWSLPTFESARQYGLNWAQEAIKSGLKPVIKVANMIIHHIDQIANYARHRITSGKAEGINSVVMAIKRVARGYRTWQSFRTAILFFCGGLDVYPRDQRDAS